MSFRGASLRSLVEKWLGAELAACARVPRFSHARRKQWRYVCVQARGSSSNFAFVFFRHDDGSWCVSARYQTTDNGRLENGRGSGHSTRGLKIEIVQQATWDACMSLNND
jgi:hypothetical protein